MEWLYFFFGGLAALLFLWLATKVVSEYAIGHFEGRRNMVPEPPHEWVWKWAYLKGHKKGVKRGR